MSKGIFKGVAIIAGAVAVVASGGAALGVGAVIGSMTAATIATIASVVSAAASLGAQALTKPPPARGSVTQMLISPDAPTPYVMGEGYFAGVQRHDTAYGPTLEKVPNPYRFMPIVYSLGPVESIEPQVDFAPLGTWYSGFLYTDTQLGAVPEADALQPEWPNAPGWGADHKLSGLAAIGWSFKFDKDGKRFASGIPLIGAYGKWVKIYDPRKDSTFPGGSGTHRLGDESTYEWSENPALHAAMYCYGRYQNGKRVFGIGMPAEGIDWNTVVAWANTCDANAWTIFGVIYEPGDRWQNLKDICFAGGGEPVVGGVMTFKYATPVVALDTITIDDLTEDSRSVMAMQPYRSRLNTVIPKCRSQAHKWEMIDAEPVVNTVFLTDDGEEKRDVWPFNFVKNVDQAAQLAAYRLFDTRELAPIKLVCKPRLRHYRPGECLYLDIPSLGLATDAILLSRDIDPVSMKVTMELMGETPTKHAYCLGQVGVAPPVPVIGQTAQERDELAAAVDPSVPQIVGVPSSLVQAKTNGDPAEGEIPFNTTFRLLYRGVDRSNSATWSVTLESGVMSMSVGATGVVTVTNLESTTAAYAVKAVIDGVETEFIHQVSKRIAGVDLNTGTGGTSAADNTFTPFNDNVAFVVVSDVLNISTGTNGVADLSAPLSLKVGSGSPVGNYSCTLRWQQDVGGTWTDVGVAYASGTSNVEPDGTVIPASIKANESLTLTASTAYSFRLTAKANEADGVTRYLTGTASASGS